MVNALSEWLELTIWRDGKEHWMKFAHGDAVAPLKVVGDAPPARKGTRVTFMPSTDTFKNVTEFDFEKLEHRYRELAFLNSGVRIVLRDKRHDKPLEHDLFYEGGIGAFVKYLDRNKQPLVPEPISVSAEKEGIGIDVALEWNDSYYENVLAFTNNIPQRDGGTHLAAFRAALTRTINNYAEKSGLLKKEKVQLTGEDMREGLTAIVSVKLPDPKFGSQTKDKLVSSEVRQPLESLMGEKMSEWLEENPADAKRDHPEDRRRRRRARSRPQGARDEPQGRDERRLAARQARRTAASATRPSASCSWSRATAPAARPRAGATASTRRSCRCAARSSTSSARASTGSSARKEVGTLIQAMGTGIRDEFTLDKLRYHKIVIMTDADVDGAHIRTLLLTFFHRQMPEIIKAGHLFIAQPPLFKVSKGRCEVYLKDQAALDRYLVEAGLQGRVLETARRRAQRARPRQAGRACAADEEPDGRSCRASTITGSSRRSRSPARSTRTSRPSSAARRSRRPRRNCRWATPRRSGAPSCATTARSCSRAPGAG